MSEDITCVPNFKYDVVHLVLAASYFVICILCVGYIIQRRLREQTSSIQWHTLFYPLLFIGCAGMMRSLTITIINHLIITHYLITK